MKVPFVNLKLQHEFLEKEIKSSLSKIIEESTFTRGTYLERFEDKFAKFVGVNYCVGVASGTDALLLSLATLNIEKNDEVILPVNTFVATAYAALYLGAKPVFVDVDPDTFNIDPGLIEKKITKKTKVLLPVHLYGQPAEIDKILSIAAKYSLNVVEDSAQTHGASYKKKNVGSFGKLAAFSFYPTKNLGAFGDAGAITTNSNRLAKRLKSLREYGEAGRYLYQELGYLSRMDQIQAAVLSIKLKLLKNWNKERQKIAKYYTQRIKREIPNITPPKVAKHSTHVYYQYVIRSKNRSKLTDFLKSKGVYTGIYYPTPLHIQKPFKNLGYRRGDFPIAEKLAKEMLSLPIYPGLTKNQQDYVINCIKDFYIR